MIEPENIDAALARQQNDAEAEAAVTDLDNDGPIVPIGPDLMLAERIVLGSLMGPDATVYFETKAVREEHFAGWLHRYLFRQIEARAKAGYYGDAIIRDVDAEAEPLLTQMLEVYGGVEYLRDAALLATMDSADFGGALDQIVNGWKARTILGLAGEVADAANAAASRAFSFWSDQSSVALDLVGALLTLSDRAMALARADR